MKSRTPAPFQLHCKVTAIFPSSVVFAVSPYCWLFFSSSQPMKTLPIVRPANDNLFILLFHQSNKVVACDCHCFNNCLISKVCAQISNSLSYTQISKRPSAAITNQDIYQKLATVYKFTVNNPKSLSSNLIQQKKHIYERILPILQRSEPYARKHHNNIPTFILSRR